MTATATKPAARSLSFDAASSLLSITQGGRTRHYFCERLPSTTPGVVTVELRKDAETLVADTRAEASYTADVTADGRPIRCTCPAGRFIRPCVHRAAIATLVLRGHFGAADGF